MCGRDRVARRSRSPAGGAALRVALVVATVLALPFAAVIAASSEPPLAAPGIEAGLLAVVALVAYILSCRSATALDRARLQWAGWGVVVSGALTLAIALMHQLVGWPDGLGVPIVVATLFVPIALGFSAFDRVALRIDRLLVRTIEVGGLVVLVGIVYVVVVLGFGESPTDSERRVLGLSMVAAAIAALLFVPAATGSRRSRTGASTATAKHPTSRCRPSVRACRARSRSKSCCCSSPSR